MNAPVACSTSFLNHVGWVWLTLFWTHAGFSRLKVKKLQLPLKDFQRLCILKGVYPREPSNRRKVCCTDSTPHPAPIVLEADEEQCLFLLLSSPSPLSLLLWAVPTATYRYARLLTLNYLRMLVWCAPLFPTRPLLPPRSPLPFQAGKGNSAARTYYHTKDILFLSHEPLIKKFREFKVFAKKLRKAVAKKETKQQERLEKRMPVVNLNHLVKERYPQFTDAVRDLDDAMCMLFLFAEMPTTHKVGPERIAKCKLLVDEFLQYVVKARALKKVFLSIKGIYYQAEVMGQPITWVTPYKFAMQPPTDVDFRIMDTFLHFYTTLVGFVNCRLYSTLNLKYPPKVDGQRAKDDAGMSAFVLEKVSASGAAAGGAGAATTGGEADADAGEGGDSDGTGDADADAGGGSETKRVVTAKQVKKLAKKISKIAAVVDTADEESGAGAAAAADGGMDAFPAQMEGGEDTVAEIAAATGAVAEAEEFTKLFDGMWFFLHREVPKTAVEFVVRSFGGKVSWQGVGDEDTLGRGPFKEDDARVTHHIVDRPAVSGQRPERHYVQPQWVFDCINQRQVLPTAPYTVGAVLPPHLSPFEVAEDDGYVPPEADKSAAAAALDLEDSDEEEVDAADEDGESENDEEELYRKELADEAAGIAINESDATAAGAKKEKKKAKKIKTAAEEQKELAISMMPKKHAKLYGKIMHGKAKKIAEADKLRSKRKAHDEAQKKSKKKAKQGGTR